MFEANSLVDIANAALSACGARAIEKLEDNNDERSMQVSYLMRQAILDVEGTASRPWKELLSVSKIVLKEPEPVVGEWCYNCPSDSLMVVAMADNGGWFERGFREEGGVIYSRKKLTYCKCVRQSFKPAEWSHDLRGCVIALLTARLYGVVSKSPDKSIQMEQAFWKDEFVRRIENKIVAADSSDEQTPSHYNDGGSVAF